MEARFRWLVIAFAIFAFLAISYGWIVREGIVQLRERHNELLYKVEQIDKQINPRPPTRPPEVGP